MRAALEVGGTNIVLAIGQMAEPLPLILHKTRIDTL